MSKLRRPAVCLLLSVASAFAEDCPQFRGRDRDGVFHETGLLKTFPETGLPIRWRKPLGWGISSPVITQGRVFVTDAELNPPAAKERVLCFSEATGELLWTHAYKTDYPDWAWVHGTGVGPCGTPVVEGERVFAPGSNGEVLCLATKSGALIWQRHFNKEYAVRTLECRASPLLDDDLLIVLAYGTPGATVVALDKATGKDVWKALDEPVASSSPVIVTAAGVRQLIVWTGASVSSLNPATGAIYWRIPMATSSNDSISTPVVEGRRLLISGLMLELDPSQPAAKVLWPEKLAGTRRILSHTCTPILRVDVIYGARSTGELVCLDAATGTQLWVEKKITTLRNGSAIHLTPCGDITYLFTDGGDLLSAELTPHGFHEISRIHLLRPTTPFMGPLMAWCPPSYANGHIFVRNDEEIICASLRPEP